MFKLIRKTNKNFDQNVILKAIWRSIWRYFGLKEANKIGLWLVDLDLNNNYGIIRCSHLTKELIISALTLITEISGEEVIINPVKTSGTIKSLQKLKNAIIKNVNNNNR